jgi:archaemetzincin
VEGIALWWIGDAPADDRVLDEVRRHVEQALATPTLVWSRPERPSGTLDPVRRQHSSTAMLKWLLTQPSNGTRLIGITDADLFIPVLTFVFGEAKLGGGVAVVSTARLGMRDGQPVDRRVLVARLAKESIHELGHAFGLIHCSNVRCVMARSASIVHVDAKSGALCHDCRIRFAELTPLAEGEAHG